MSIDKEIKYNEKNGSKRCMKIRKNNKGKESLMDETNTDKYWIAELLKEKENRIIGGVNNNEDELQTCKKRRMKIRRNYKYKESLMDEINTDKDCIAKILNEKENKIIDVVSNNEDELKKGKNKKTIYTMKSRNRKTLVTSKILDLIINKHKLLCINEELYVYSYEYGYFKCLSKHKERVFIRQCLNENKIVFTRATDIEDIIYSLKTDPRIQKESSEIEKNRNLINTKSGVYDIKISRMLEHSHKYIFFNCIDAEYDYDNYRRMFEESRFSEFLKEITNYNEELEQRLKEIVGYCLCTGNQLRQFYILVGEGSNGKSVFLDLISSLIGEDNISNVALNQLENQSYVASLFGKVLNVGSDLSDFKINDTSAIKSLVNDTDKIICRPLYRQPFSFTNYCKLIFATNNLPQLKNGNHRDNSAFFNRAIIIPFNNIVPEEKQDKNLVKKLKKERNLVLNWAIEGLEQIRNNGWHLSRCKISEEYSKKYRETESYVERFINEKLRYCDGNTVFKSDIKDIFKEFCTEEGIDENINISMKYVHKLLTEKGGIDFKKIRIKDKSKHGYIGLKII